MDDFGDRIADKVQALSDIELAALLCLITDQHCIIEGEKQSLDELEHEIRLVARNLFGLTWAVLECSESTTVDEFGAGILVDEIAGDYFSLANRSAREEDLRYAAQPGSPKKFTGRSSRPFTPLDSRKIANVVIAKNFNIASNQVQVQALELIRGKRNFTRTAVHAAPKPFLFIALNAIGTASLSLHLNDQLFISHKHQIEDGFPNLEELHEKEPIYDDDASTSSVVRSPPKQEDSVMFTEADLNELTNLTAKVSISTEVRAYLHNIVIFMRQHRAVGGGISAMATRHFDMLSRALAPLHGLSYITPALVALAARKVYPHRIKITTPENERSLQWGSSLDAVRAVLEGVTPDDVVEEVLQSVEVVFAPNDIRRRKSSLVPATAQRPAHRRQKTQCFVHTLLEKHDGISVKDRDASYEGLAQERMLDKDPHGHADESQHSRLLTKKQISDMAFGIRELSKKLAQIRLKLHVRNIFILAKAHDETLIKHTRETVDWLLTKDPGYRVYVEETLEHNKLFDAKSLLQKDSFEGRLKFWTNELCHDKPQTFDIALALGGDGTVLYASWLFQRIVPPVLAFSLGSLGFLTKFDYEQYPLTLSRAFDEGITVSLRLRFEATIMRSQTRDNPHRDLVEELIGEESEDHHTHRPDGTHNILNEVVVDRGPNPTMSSIELFGDDEHFTTVQADGICVSTPTGSTAYNLAAGGSLCHPDNPVILVTAICAHTLSFRPIILPDTIVLRAGVPYDARMSSWASFDGRERVELKPGDYVTISASRFPFPSVLPLDRKSKDWIDSISRTLQWNSRQRQKSFKEWS
ncbi:hypothetical protein DPSP01_004932 [Paraphaeosphaeria sporulosa]